MPSIARALCQYFSSERQRLGLVVIQLLFLVSALVGLNAPFVSMHFVRQNQTFDVAQNVYNGGWNTIFYPRASFSQLSVPDDALSPVPVPCPRYTVIHLEVPFHGIIGWPAAQFFPRHERAIARLVSVLFSLILMGYFYGIARHWLSPTAALAGACLLATSPLLVHFGQVPMPDILATCGIAGALFFALKNRIIASSGWFTFAVLAKLSIIIYGLPILVALLRVNPSMQFFGFCKTALFWGVVPLVGILSWISLGLHDPYGSWVVYGGYRPGNFGPVGIEDLKHFQFYIPPLMYLIPFGCGLLGLICLLFAFPELTRKVDVWLLAAISGAILFNYVFERIVWREPQYSMPVLFWVISASTFGLSRFIELAVRNRGWALALALLVLVQVVANFEAIRFLKVSRVPNLKDIETAAAYTPASARIVVYADTPSASPSTWLERNTLKLNPIDPTDSSRMAALYTQLQALRATGFEYLLVFDVRNSSWRDAFNFGGEVYDIDHTSEKSLDRQFFDSKFPGLFRGNHVVLYSLRGGE